MVELSRRAHRRATAGLALLAGLVVWTVAHQVFPYHSLNHDEGVYLQQAAMLLEGQLSLSPPVDDAMRPWFFVDAGERMYPKYAPVPAAMFALGKVAGSARLALAGIAAANVALAVGVVREVFDRPTGLLAGALVLASPLFVVDSSVFLPYAPTTLLNLAFAYAYLRADRAAADPGRDDEHAAGTAQGGVVWTTPRRWAAAAGAAVGLAFFSRPYTAVLFATPFIVHALWTLRGDWRRALPRQVLTAALGSAGVAVTLAYNAAMTGSALLFPYQAFAPADGLGFGHREILAHEVQYTPELALRANALVLEQFATDWVAGGLYVVALAALGVAATARGSRSPRAATLAGVFLTVPVGNVYFWGNFNVLGALDRPGDGLINVLGPYYHFDLLVPTAAFAAVGALWAGRRLRSLLDSQLDRRRARAVLVAVVLASTVAVGGATAPSLDHRLEENMEVTRTYEDAYAPFEDGPPPNSVVLLPDPYGDWLNHPFQPLRNDPGFDGRAVYAIDDEPFAVVDAFPDRTVYRYGYRGPWAPWAGSPEVARLQRVRDVRGERVRLDATLGVPDGAVGVTVRVSTDEGTAYYVAPELRDSLSLSLVVAAEDVHVEGDVRPVAVEAFGVHGRDGVVLTVFVDYGAGRGFSYRLETHVDVEDGRVRALSPRVEHCRNVRACGGAATYVPGAAPEGVFVRTNLTATGGAG